ncbi:phage tail tape measure protein [Agathobaculum sp. NTUH-O15-33]|uniref:phage tail tape measure protein n=1 Tax=Agathobaculum sp. NTUH-O15-33 TaxID=3079302 RepID=UPI0029588972|nr:phage tail tape measure protein [Agathobaculum sp. NTUH-O15-33]WNX86041.1 phage tail tape measure protein [Agathobaculum sp. NTUH-O15-33]
MANRIKGITVEIGGDTTKLQTALKGVNGEIKNTQAQLKDVEKLLKLDPGNTELLAQKHRLLGQAVEETKGKLQTLKVAAEQANTALANGDISQEQYDALQREIIETERNLEDLERAANESSVALQSVAAKGEQLKTVGSNISSVGTSLSKNVTAPIIAIGAASVAAFNEVDSGLDIIEQKTGAAGKSLEEMESICKNMATEIPTDFETAGAAIGEVNTRFGVTGTALETLSTKFVKFASLNNTDVSTSVDNVQKALTAFGLGADDAGAMLDTMNAVGQKTGISMDTLSASMVSNASAFKQMGLSASDAAAFLGQCEVSGTDTSAVMTGLTKALKEATDNGQPLDQALADIQNSMVNAKSDTEGLSAAYEMFGSRAGGKIYEACKSGSLSFEALGTSLTDNLGSVDDTYAATLDGTDAMVTGMNALKIAGAAVGDAIGTTLAPILQALAKKLKEFADWFTKLSPGMQQMIVKIAMIVAAVGPVLVIIGKVVSAVGTIMTIVPKLAGVIHVVKGAFAALNAVMLANPIMLIIAAIAALVAAFIYLWNTNEDFRQFWIDLWENIKEVAIAVWNAIKEFFVAVWEGIKSVAETVWNALASFFTGLWEGIKTVFTTAVTAISTFLSTTWNTIKTVVTTVFTAIQTFFTTVWNTISTIVTTVVTAIQTFLTTAWNAIKTAITTVLTAIQTVVTTVWNAISTFIATIITAIQTFLTTAWNTIKTVITTVLNAIKTVFTTIWNAIKTVITTVVNGIKNTITTVWNNIKSTVSSVVNGIKSAVSNAFSAMWNGIKNTISGIYNTIKGGFDKAVGYIKNLASSAFNWGKDLVMGIVNGIKSCISAVGDAVSGVANKIKSFLHFSVPDEGPLTDYETWMPDFMSGLAKGIEKSKGMVANAMDGVAADMVVNPKISTADTSGILGGASAGDALAGITTAITEALAGVGGQGGDIVIPVYLGGTMLDEVVVNAQQRTNLRSGGR